MTSSENFWKMREAPFLTSKTIYEISSSMHPSDRAENSKQNEWSHDSLRLSGEKLEVCEKWKKTYF
jgi:hypothetical protein